MSDEKRGPIKVPVRDKRRTAPVDEATKVAEETLGVGAEEVQEPDYLDDLQRLQAEFENYRKRMMRDQVGIGARAKAVLIESLLPVIDNFERAIEHGEGGEGVRLVFKELENVLQTSGLEEIAAEGAPFDPHVHEAVESIQDPDVGEPTVRAVHRRGFKIGDRVIRPAMVAVANPADRQASPVQGTEQ